MPVTNAGDREGIFCMIVRILGEIYLSVFIIGYKIGEGQWPKEMNADVHKGITLVSIVDGCIIVSFFGIYDVLGAGFLHLGRFYIIIFGLIIFMVNGYILDWRGIGPDFEKKFRKFSRNKQILLYAMAVGVCIAAAASFYFTVVTHQRMASVQ